MREYVKTRTTKPYPTPLSEREELQNMLWGIGVAIPYSGVTDPHHPLYVEMSELRDLVQWQMEKTANEPEFRKGAMTEQARETGPRWLSRVPPVARQAGHGGSHFFSARHTWTGVKE
jgi:hypothetical protein